MARTVRFLRRLPQQQSLTGRRSPTSVYQRYSDRQAVGVPSLGSLAQTPAPISPVSDLNDIVPQQKRLNVLPDVGGPGAQGETGTSTPGTANPFGAVGEEAANIAGQNIAASMLGRGVKGITNVGIQAQQLGVPLGVALPIGLQNAVMSALSPIGLPMSALGQAISAQTAAKGVSESPTLAGQPAIAATQAAIANSPQTAFGHLGSLIGLGPSASEATEAAVSAAEQGLTGITGVAASSQDPTASLFGSNPALGSVVGSMLGRGSGGTSGTEGFGEPPGVGNIGGVGPAGGYGGGGVGGTGPSGTGPGGYGGGESGDVGYGGGGDGGGGGGTVICSELYRQGIMPKSIYEADRKYGSRLPDEVIQGYHTFGIPLARLMGKSRLVTALVKFPALSWAKQMAHVEGVLPNPNRAGKLIEKVGVPLCRMIGKIRAEIESKPNQLPLSDSHVLVSDV